MAAKVKHVWCNDGDSSGKSKLGHIVRSLYTAEDGTDKADIFVDGRILPMAYREPGDRDEQGAGLTYWNIVTDVEGSNYA